MNQDLFHASLVRGCPLHYFVHSFQGTPNLQYCAKFTIFRFEKVFWCWVEMFHSPLVLLTLSDNKQMASVPTNLVVDGILTTHHIYRTARVKNNRTDLLTGQVKDDFPDVVRDANVPNTGHIPSCRKSLANGDDLSSEQWTTLTNWNAGLSCQIYLKHPKQSIVIDVFGNDFLKEFNSAKGFVRDDENPKNKIPQFLCYELQQGTPIPSDVGIEQDGDNHVCLYPTGDINAVSNIANGDETFVIDALIPLVPRWRPFALLKFKAKGYCWPESFPDDNTLFPIRQWVQAVMLSGEADLAVSLGSYTEDFVSGSLDWPSYFKILLSIGCRFRLSCDYDDCVTNCVLMTALRYALNFNELQTNASQSFMLKSTTLEQNPAYQKRLVEFYHSDFEASVRKFFEASGGYVFVTANASIDVLLVDSQISRHSDWPHLPFSIFVDNQIIVFDEVDCSPVLEDKSGVYGR